MRKLVKFLGASLLALLVLAVAPAFVRADDGGKTGDCDWKFIEAESKLVISGNGDMADYGSTDTDHWDSAPWLEYIQMIQEIEIKDGVTSIGKYAFTWCTCLTNGVYIPDSVREVRDYAFSNSSVSYVQFFEGTQVIGEGAFLGCNELMQVYMPVVGVQQIGKAAFANTEKLQQLSLPVGLKSVGEYAFGFDESPVASPGFVRNESLSLVTGFAGPGKEFAIKNNIPFQERFTSGTTGDCTWEYDYLAKALLISGNGAMANYKQMVGAQYPITDAPWAYFAGYLTEIRIGEGVTEIGNFAFCGCHIFKINTPSTTKRIGEHAFSYCSNVKEINIKGDGCVIEEAAFSSINVSEWGPTDVLDHVSISGVQIIGKYAFSYTQSREVTFAEGLRQIGEQAFQYNDAVKELVFPGTIEYVGACAFWESKALEKVTFLDGKGRSCQIDANAFYHDTDLATLFLGEGITSVGSMAFCSTALPNVTLPDSIAMIDDHAFGFDCYASDTFEVFAVKEGFTVYASCKSDVARDYAALFNLPFVPQHDVVAKVTKATPEKDGKRVLKCGKCGAQQARATVIPMVSKISLSKKAFVYNGKNQRPTVIVKDRTDKELASSRYTLFWSSLSSKNVGTYTVTVQLKGTYYTGSKKLTYTIRPAKVTGLKAVSVSTTAIKLRWNAAAGAKYYALYGAREGEGYKKIDITASTEAIVRKVNDKALAPGESYRFKVRGLDLKKANPGLYSDELETGTKTSAPLITKAGSPKSKTVSVAYNKVKGAEKYTIYVSADNKNYSKKGTTTRTSYTFSGIRGGMTIYIKVTAFNKYGVESARSKEVAVKVRK